MISSTISNNGIANKQKRDYPYLGIFDDKYIVLFNRPKCGMVVEIHSDHTDWKIGDYNEGWDENMFNFMDLPLIIQNKY